MSEKTEDLRNRPIPWGKILKFFLLSPLIGGFLAGLIGVVFVLVSYAISPASVTVGSGPDPEGVSLLIFVAWGFAGSLVGLVVGVIGSIVLMIVR